ncbi:hypothetical protein LXL04_003938 [Taraxacum kok-saghyz]
MAGHPSQGWSKFGTKYNSCSTSDPNGKPWKMPIEMKANLEEEQCLLDQEALRIQKEKEQLSDLEEEIVNKETWIKRLNAKSRLLLLL